MNKTEDSDAGQDLNPAQTSGSSPPACTNTQTRPTARQISLSSPMPYQERLRQLERDRQKMAIYVARCIPDEGKRVVLHDGTLEYPPTIADVSKLWVEGELEILIETNDPENVDLKAVYEHFRWDDMTLDERRRHLSYVPRWKQTERPHSSPPPVPQWNAELRALSYGGQLIKQFKQAARNQEVILSAFEEEHWPSRIDDPLSGAGEQRQRLNDTLRDLNRKHCTPGLIHFNGDGTGEGIVWTCMRR